MLLGFFLLAPSFEVLHWHVPLHQITTMAQLPPTVVLPERNILLETIGIDHSNSLDFTVYVAPKALRCSVFVARLRRAVNPDRRHIELFRQHMRVILANLTLPYFYDMTSRVYMGITFRIRRPNYHYVNGDRNRVVKLAYVNSRGTRGDIDNMVKFVMDASNLILYTDDRQVTCLYANKIWHEDSTSNGSVTIAVKLHTYM
jgi:Holliday junction resolvase RusA-like endonuclease